MENIYTALGLMSGTSLDGIDVSIIESDGNREYTPIFNKYFKYDDKTIQKISIIREKILNSKDLNLYSKEINTLEKDLTLSNAKAVNETIRDVNQNVDVIGFHGQTIFHNPDEKITKQLGNGKLLSQLTKRKVVFNFRQNDLKNGGQGAPLTPIFHSVVANKISKKFKIDLPISILNIGGISNATLVINENDFSGSNQIYAHDIGPGNCLINEWIRKNSKKQFDEGGIIARSGKIDEFILNQALDNFSLNLSYEKSLDIKDFDIFFAKGLSYADGAATITDFTAKLIADGMNFIQNKSSSEISKWLVCGGGRKNKFLLERIKNNFKKINFDEIDKFEIEGDFIEAQAFAFLAIRSLKGKPISFPSTTRCKKPVIGGEIVENF